MNLSVIHRPYSICRDYFESGNCFYLNFGISDHDLVNCTGKISLLKRNIYKKISIRSVENYTKEKLLELIRKTDFPDYATYTCLKKAYQDFIIKSREVIDLFYPSKKLRLVRNLGQTLKQFQQFIRGMISYSKNIKNLAWGLTKIIFDRQMALQKAISKKKKSDFQ